MSQTSNKLDLLDLKTTLQSPHDHPIVREIDDRMILRFDSRAVQSEMHKHDPYKLVLSYTRLMMGFLLFHPAPRDILIVGLGGGSLSKYCYRHLPKSRITTVEINAKVIALRERFAIPHDDDRFRIIQADGAQYIADCSNSADVILLDGFDADGLPTRLGAQRFYHQCHAALRNSGVLVANFLSGEWSAGRSTGRLGMAFNNQVLVAKPDRGFNLIAFALKRDRLPEWSVLRDRALDLETIHDLNFRAMASKIQSNIRPNRAFF
jgi:spermidine synthase